MGFRVNGVNTIISTLGALGMGTLTPAANIDITAETANALIVLTQLGSGPALNVATGEAVFYGNVRILGNLISSILSSLTVSGNTAIDTNVLFVDTVGNKVGVGTTTPTQALDVVGSLNVSANITATAIKVGPYTVWHSGTLDVGANTVWHSGNDGGSSGLDAGLLDGNSSTFFTNSTNQTTGTLPSARLSGAYTGITALGSLTNLDVSGSVNIDTNVLRVDQAGRRVGINTAVPNTQTTLHITTDSTPTANISAIYIQGNSDVANGARVILEMSPRAGVLDGGFSGGATFGSGRSALIVSEAEVTPTAAALSFWTNPGGPTQERMRINRQGRVAINKPGQWNVSAQLDVTGNGNFTTSLNVGTNLAVGTNIFVGANLVWHQGNDGSGSGLDADLLDGNNSAFFTNSTNQTAGTLPSGRLSGDYSGITGLGTLLGLNVTGIITATSNIRVGSNTVWHGGNYGEHTANAAGDGTNDDTAALQSVLSAGQIIRLHPSKSYKVSRRLIITANNTGIEGQGGRIIANTANGAFDNGNYGVYGANGCIVYAANVSGPFVRNTKIETSAWREAIYIKPIYFVDTRDIDVSGNEITQFSRGRGLITLLRAYRGTIRHNFLHDCYSNSIYEKDGSTPATSSTVQITGIEVDDNNTGAANSGSYSLDISHNTIGNLTSGLAITGAIQGSSIGAQTDAINILGTNTKPTHDCTIAHNDIYNVVEGIDCFGRNNVIENNRIKKPFGAGIKLIHGARDNKIRGNDIEDAAYVGILMGASPSVTSNADGNEIIYNTITNCNTPGDWAYAGGGNFATTGYWSAYTTAGIRIDILANASSYISNTWIAHNTIDCGNTAQYGIYIEGTATGPYTNRIGKNHIKGYKLQRIMDLNGYFVNENQQRHLLRQTTLPRTLANNTNYQPIFDCVANGSVILDRATTYKMKGYITVTDLSSSSGNVHLRLDGTATYTYCNWRVVARKGGGVGVPNWSEWSTNTGGAIVSASTSTSCQIEVEGIIKINQGGTCVPSIQQGIGATGNIGLGSYIEFTEDTSQTTLGTAV